MHTLSTVLHLMSVPSSATQEEVRAATVKEMRAAMALLLEGELTAAWKERREGEKGEKQ